MAYCTIRKGIPGTVLVFVQASTVAQEPCPKKEIRRAKLCDLVRLLLGCRPARALHIE